MPTLYVLKCKSNKYYIGKTNNNVSERIESHFAKQGSAWTKMYPPEHVIEVINNVDAFDEDKYTKIYMHKYGIDNVRGGSYSQITLEDYKIKALNDEFSTITNVCFKCKRTGHFIKDCYATGTPISSSTRDDVWYTPHSSFHTTSVDNMHRMQDASHHYYKFDDQESSQCCCPLLLHYF
jgi:predicted GIY-YIG superfamily endonuclease